MFLTSGSLAPAVSNRETAQDLGTLRPCATLRVTVLIASVFLVVGSRR